MKTQKSTGKLIFATLTALLLAAGCTDSLSPFERVPPPLQDEAGEFDTRILPESRQYDLSDKTIDAVIDDIKLINQSDSTLHYLAPSFNVTLQKWNGRSWEDRGAWYDIIGIGPFERSLAPGDTLGTTELDLRSVASNRDIMGTSSFYRFHYEVYRTEKFEELIPEVDRVSEPFKVIL